MSRISILLFAQTPPPEHGQSRMVLHALRALEEDADGFDVHHVNARFSETIEDVGHGSAIKGIKVVGYLFQAACERLRFADPLLYYVPGPVKWSAVVRDWVALSVLRLLYPKVVLHWHAIGQGEWAHGSERLAIRGPAWLDRMARKISSAALDHPHASICVAETSNRDATATVSHAIFTVYNGIEDPCPDYESVIAPARRAAERRLRDASHPCFRILFLSHGTVEKGLLDAVEALKWLVQIAKPQWQFAITFAGGVSNPLKARFQRAVEELQNAWGDRLQVQLLGYVDGEDKRRCYADHDIFLAPSRWESFGLTVVEAMAYGMQIVAAASDGVKGVLPDDHSYLAPVNDPAALADRLHKCFCNLSEHTCEEERKLLRRRFLERYQIEHFARNLRSALADADRRSSPEAKATSKARMLPVAQEAAYAKRPSEEPKLNLQVYLADQNPGYDRSFGISRMSQSVIAAIHRHGGFNVEAVVSQTSQQAPTGVAKSLTLPWGTRRKSVRFITDHLHPMLQVHNGRPDVHYFPKGYLPLLSLLCRPSVVTIHDVIVQYDGDHYPKWRRRWEYGYWSKMLQHTLRSADRILTVSETSRQQILEFMLRHGIPSREIKVTYEPCAYEQLPQPVNPCKENYVLHLASVEPHKRTAHLIRWWREAESRIPELPPLHLIGSVPSEVLPLLSRSRKIVKRPFLDDAALQDAYRNAHALILPSEIEGFGLPALEAYYLGTPVCFVRGTSVEEILGVATSRGGFSLDDMDSLFSALDDVMRMDPEEVRQCGLKLRDAYACEKVAAKMAEVFREVAVGSHL